jgi:hypothetical protein
VAQHAFVEGGEHAEFSGAEQVDEMPADVVHVLGRCDLDGAAPGRQEADDDDAGIGGIGFAADQPEVPRAPDLVESRLFSHSSETHSSRAGIRPAGCSESAARIT